MMKKLKPVALLTGAFLSAMASLPAFVFADLLPPGPRPIAGIPWPIILIVVVIVVVVAIILIRKFKKRK